MALIGYARVSTTEQHLHLQQDALTAAGCLKIFTDTISDVKTERKGLAEALDFIRTGDTLVSPGHDLLYTSSDLSQLDFPAKNPLSQQLTVAQNTT